MAWWAKVLSEGPNSPKWKKLGEPLGGNRHMGFGLAVSLWCLCWRKEWLDGRIPDDFRQQLAEELRWEGPNEALIEAMVAARVLDRDQTGSLRAHGFTEHQSMGIKAFAKSRSRSKDVPKDVLPPQKPEQGVAKEIERQLLQQMKLSKIPGSLGLKRDHIAAWRARGVQAKSILEAVTNNPGKNVFELEKILTGANHGSALEAAERWAKKEEV